MRIRPSDRGVRPHAANTIDRSDIHMISRRGDIGRWRAIEAGLDVTPLDRDARAGLAESKAMISGAGSIDERTAEIRGDRTRRENLRGRADNAEHQHGA